MSALFCLLIVVATLVPLAAIAEAVAVAVGYIDTWDYR